MNKVPTYKTDFCADNNDLLQNRLDMISECGGRVISAVWQPSREVVHYKSKVELQYPSQWVLISEYQDKDAQGS